MNLGQFDVNAYAKLGADFGTSGPLSLNVGNSLVFGQSIISVKASTNRLSFLHISLPFSTFLF